MHRNRVVALGVPGVVGLFIATFGTFVHYNHVASHATPGVLRRRAPAQPREIAPEAPVAVVQVGGREPSDRAIAAGGWINSSDVTLIMRTPTLPGRSTVQPQVELRPANQPFNGRPTALGQPILAGAADGAATIKIAGLHDGAAYHWRARLHDARGLNSPWTGPTGIAVRVSLTRPASPAVALVVPASHHGWIPTRRMVFSWSPPVDRTGIRGYSYTLSRSPGAQPLARWRTNLTHVTVQALHDGDWFFSVRALNDAHTWGPPAWVAVHVETRLPRIALLSAPTGAINPRRIASLLTMRLTSWSQVRVAIASLHGPIRWWWQSPPRSPGAQLVVAWDGRDSAGRLLPNGVYEMRIVATNRAGATWQTTRRVHVVGEPAGVTQFGLSQTGTFNPYNSALDGEESITATLNAPAHVRIEALHGALVRREWVFDVVRAGQVVTATWGGTASDGSLLPDGLYTFRAVATDVAGNRTVTPLGWVMLDQRRIVVSLAQQRLWALDGHRVLLTSLVTTGGPELPTPTGTFQIIDRESPFTFHSPFPIGSPYWYPDSPTTFALLFQADGYFIHDAPWRTYYGPGSNVDAGTPGHNTTGTHGCVNVPYNQMAWLFQWATMYTPVDVVTDFTPPVAS